MRFLFYLPVVTPWWFANILLPLIEKLAGEHAIEVLAPLPWRGTGIGQQEVDLCAHLPHVRWHLVQDAAHPSLRTDPPQRDAIVSFVASLKPDYVLCRSADLRTTELFPGVVRHLTEGAADPLVLAPSAIHFTASPFDHGVLPPLDGAQIAELDRLIEPHWEALAASVQFEEAERRRFREWAGLPDDRPVLCLPLEYEHEENFFTIHRIGARPNAAMVEELLGQLGEHVFLALTNHPLNEAHVDNTALRNLALAYPSRMRLLPPDNPLCARTTWRLLREVDGVILGDSKVFSVAGLIGTPILRRTRFKTGGWLNAADDIAAFASDIVQGSAATPDRARARTWFAFHVANNLLWSKAPDLTAPEIIAHLDRPVDPARWERKSEAFAQMRTKEPA